MLQLLINDSMSTTDKIMKIAGFIGMVVSITVAFYLIFSASAPDAKTPVFIFSLGCGLALGYLSFAIKQKSRN